MNVSRLTRRLTISSLLGVTALGMAVIPASAGQATPATGASLLTSSVASGTPKPHVTIKGSPGTFAPTALTAKPKKFKTCSAKAADMTIANKTKNPKTITYGSSTLGVIPANTTEDVCQYGPAGYVFVYGIQGSTSTLSVTMS
jgi:hypothetical protein